MCAIKRIVIGVAFLMLPSLPAQPADVNFDPIVVNVWQLHSDVTSVAVTCSAKDDAGQWIMDTVYVQAANSVNPPEGNLDASKNFSGNLQAGLNFPNPASAAKAKTYFCDLRLTCMGQCSGTTPPGAQGLVKSAEIGDRSQWWHVKTGTLTMSGPIWSVPQNAPQPLKTFEAWGFPN